VAVIGWMHGDEPVGGPALRRLEGLLSEGLVAGAVLVVLANMSAQQIERRHTPEGVDMNRLWDAENLARIQATPERDLFYEERRVKVLAPLLLECDAILDLHSTSRPSPPFLLFRDDRRHAAVASRLGVRRLVTGVHEGAILEGGLSITVGLQPGERSARMGYLFEAGQHRDPENVDRACQVAVRLFGALEMWADAVAGEPLDSEVYEVMDRFRQAAAGAEQWRFAGFGEDRSASGRRGPPRRLVSFEDVEADEVLLRNSARVVRARTPFTMLMPAPDAEPGADLYFVAQPRFGGLGVAPRDDEEARREAGAIERMLDLMDDDDFASGTTWASFDDRVLLDLCADIVGRVLRLPPGHPHRRITVVGRGDWGGSETERRTGQRYRSAMRRALVAGVPLERIQLLRGAALGWIDSLTSSSTARMLGQRDRSDQASAVDLYLSARQPHTLSVLVIGDLDRALRDGDMRHVRVALVVEATTVFPKNGDADVRVVRAGLISGRPEVVRAARQLRNSLQAEHRVLVSRPPLGDDPAFLEALGENGAIRPSDDPVRMRALRRALRGFQIGLWCRALALARFDVGQMDARAAGEWIASTMAVTGIRDAHALQSLLVRETESTWRPDVALLREACTQPETFAPSPPTPAPAPRQALCAADVDADGLERWVGWKRFLRRAKVIPDTRGKDVDLALRGTDIHRRVVGIYRRALELARRQPGQVLVVVAGDGHTPLRMGDGAPRESLYLHRTLVRDPAVRYLRIQHAQGTHLSWMKDLLRQVGQRPSSRAPVCLQLEEEHGSLVNIVLLAVRDPVAREVDDPWTLEGWRPLACGVVLTEFEVGGRDYAVGMFTEPIGAGGRLNLDLLHFGRAHCQGLLDQVGARQRFDCDSAALAEFQETLVELIAAWVSAVRGGTDRALSAPPPHREGRMRWVAEELGLADPILVAALADEIDGARDPIHVAREMWRAVEPWPG
jgi:hypothetical protein